MTEQKRLLPWITWEQLAVGVWLLGFQPWWGPSGEVSADLGAAARSAGGPGLGPEALVWVVTDLGVWPGGWAAAAAWGLLTLVVPLLAWLVRGSDYDHRARLLAAQLLGALGLGVALALMPVPEGARFLWTGLGWACGLGAAALGLWAIGRPEGQSPPDGGPYTLDLLHVAVLPAAFVSAELGRRFVEPILLGLGRLLSGPDPLSQAELIFGAAVWFSVNGFLAYLVFLAVLQGLNGSRLDLRRRHRGPTQSPLANLALSFGPGYLWYLAALALNAWIPEGGWF